MAQPAALQEDLTGRRFGALTVLRRDPAPEYRARWICRCNCGKVVAIIMCRLRHRQSCGCGWGGRNGAAPTPAGDPVAPVPASTPRTPKTSRPSGPRTVTCARCEETFTTTSGVARFCSKACRIASYGGHPRDATPAVPKPTTHRSSPTYSSEELDRYLGRMPMPPYAAPPPPERRHAVLLNSCNHTNTFGEVPPQLGDRVLCLVCCERHTVVEVRPLMP